MQKQPVVLPSTTAQAIEQLAARIGLAPYDLLISGESIGWGYFPGRRYWWIHDARAQDLTLHFAPAIDMCDFAGRLEHYLEALRYHRARWLSKPAPRLNIKLLPDCYDLVRWATRPGTRREYSCSWDGVEELEEQRYDIDWIFLARDHQFARGVGYHLTAALETLAVEARAWNHGL